MKNLAKLSVFFSVNFAIIFLTGTFVRFLSLRVEWAQNLPPRPETTFTLLITAAYWALSFAMFASILLSLSYAARREYFPLMTVLCVMALSLFLNSLITVALHHWHYVPSSSDNKMQLGQEGLILSSSINRNETAVVLLKGAAEPRGPRVAAIPGRPLVFMDEIVVAEQDDIILPPIPFQNETPELLRSFLIDIRLNAENLREQYENGLIYYLIYAVPFFFFLSSLGFAIKVSAWPLANLFIGIIAFRGVLSLETFLNSNEMQNIFETFFKNILPAYYAVPIIFLFFALLINTYAVLVYVSKRHDENEY